MLFSWAAACISRYRELEHVLQINIRIQLLANIKLSETNQVNYEPNSLFCMLLILTCRYYYPERQRSSRGQSPLADGVFFPPFVRELGTYTYPIAGVSVQLYAR